VATREEIEFYIFVRKHVEGNPHSPVPLGAGIALQTSSELGIVFASEVASSVVEMAYSLSHSCIPILSLLNRINLYSVFAVTSFELC